SPILAERPALLAGLLRDAMRVERRADPAGAAQRAATRARGLLAGHPAAQRDRFERDLAAALRAYPLREDVALCTGSAFGAVLRMIALEAGRRLVARGQLDRPEDTVHLDIDTLRAAITGGVPADLRERAARARAERAWTIQHPGPAFHGPAPAPLPDLRGLPREGRRLNEALLWMQRRDKPASTPAAGTAITGAPASPGRYTGAVRVVRGPADFGRLQPGEVLVCPTTDPAWSVLFGVAGALVTDAGGALSHAAIVAREHAIAAVVGTGTATHELRDGDAVTVDGSHGQVVRESFSTEGNRS
ncbi:MAG: PEP-utilizing enzyme, partial [Sciscionella sp.]